MNPTALPEKLFITGTDTDIGKTIVAAMLMAGTQGKYWKPIQSGLTEETDTQRVQRLTGLPRDHFAPETYRLTQPLSPHAAAAIDGVRIDLSAVVLPDPMPYPHLIVEGAGGIMVPLNDSTLMIDLMAHLQLSVLVVASSQLGTINHTLLTLEKLSDRQIEVIGVVMNGPQNDGNRQAIEHHGRTRVLAQIDPLPEINQRELEKQYRKHFL